MAVVSVPVTTTGGNAGHAEPLNGRALQAHGHGRHGHRHDEMPAEAYGRRRAEQQRAREAERERDLPRTTRDPWSG